ncbi:MAG: InlB B-repeat-containing protein [Lachnospiraceae bacterium]|nr:InlB B-repeat-containing protein [Lachnospiraceae bacterium]
MKKRIFALCTYVFMMLAGFSLFNYSSVFVYAAQGDTHRISYNLDSGTLGEGKWDTYTEGEEFTLPLPKKEGCAFLGWYENPEQSGEPVTTISAEDTGNKEFWAKWAENLFYNDFEDGSEQGWVARSSTIANTSDFGYLGSKHSIFVSGRSEDWQGVTRPLDPQIFVPGETYGFSVMAMYMNGADASKTFVLTLQYLDEAGQMQWGRITTTDGLKGQWVQLAASEYTIPKGATEAQLLVETVEGETVDFYVDNAIGTVKGGRIAAEIEEPFTVTLTRSGSDSGMISSTPHIKGTEVTITGTPRSGNKFLRWESEDVKIADSNKEVTTFTMPEADVEITAVYEALTSYTITYNLDGGTQQSGSWGVYYKGEERKLPTTPRKTGYKFGGWYDNKELTGTPVTAISSTETGNKEFWAKWIPNTYTVTYHMDGGTQQPGTDWESYTYGTGLTLPAAPTKEYHTFLGWYSNKGLTGEPVTKIPGDATGNKTFWAKWTLASYTVTYNLNGGVQQPGNHWGSYTYGTGLELPTAPTRANYTFEGWYDNAGLTGQPVVRIAETDSGEKKFWAKWSGGISQDEIAANEVIRLINEIGTITSGSGNKITSAMAAYNKLTPAQKNLVTNFGKLKEAEKTFYSIVSPASGKQFNVGALRYKVTKRATGEGSVGTVQVVGPSKSGKRITKITIPNTVAAKASNITFQYKVTSIADNAFKNCKKAVKAAIGNNVTTIGKNAFMGCKKLKSVTIGKGVKKIGTKAFYKTPALKTIRVNTTKITKKIGANAFRGIHKNAKIKVPSSRLAKYKKFLKAGQKSSVKITK